MLAWVMMGLALWHYTIWLPDRFWGGIVGALLFSIAGSIVAGLIIFALGHHGLAVPGRHDTHLSTVLYAIPGAVVGMAIAYAIGAAAEQRPRRVAR
jgi:ABC-type cobalt transport system substrate-binding protein